MSETTLTIRQIRASAKKVLSAAGVQYATSSPSSVRGWKNWSRGVIITESFTRGIIAWVVPCFDMAAARKQDLDKAVTALRAAGWTVADDGTITGVPHV